MNKKSLFSFKKSWAAFLLFSVQSVFAANLTIDPLPDVTLPTTVSPGQTVVAYFTVTNPNSFALDGYQVRGAPSSVAQDSSAPNYYNDLPICSTPVNLPANSSCLLQLDITGPVADSFALCKGSSCSTSSEPLAVTSTPAPVNPVFAYITQYSEYTPVMVCAVNQDSQLLEDCHSAGGNLLIGVYPQGIQIGNNGSTAYLTSINYLSEIIYQCPIYANTGMFGACTLSFIDTPARYEPYYGFLALNSDSTTAFINDYDSGVGRVLACPIISNTIQSTCTDTTAPADPFYIGIVLNSNNTVAYMGSYATSSSTAKPVTTCTVNGSTFSACGKKTGDATNNIVFKHPSGVALNTTNTLVYVADDYNKFVYACNTSSATDLTLFDNCVKTTNSILPFEPWGITLNANSTFAYITSYDNTVTACSILPNGKFGTCKANTAFDEAVDVALFY